MLIPINLTLPMSANETHFRRQICTIVIIKLVIIFSLWWAFFRDTRIDVDGRRLADHLAVPAVAGITFHNSGEPRAQ
ncbi:MAG: cytochrome oxidase putative small subunit CydP [Accumulibacter sp.]|uniref:cytochrome oxidase putative small subunit CydP n=1 Tax=Accumulibacter sp. TaxID=2053492 RepID=UPI0033155C85